MILLEAAAVPNCLNNPTPAFVTSSMPPDSNLSASSTALDNAVAALREARLTVDDDAAGPLRLAEALETLAGLHSALGQFEKAESHYLEAIQVVEQSGAAPDQLARLCSGLGTLYDFNQREETGCLAL